MAILPQHWMKTIDDSQSLTHVTIPGTHDSCALFGGDLPTCQTLTITNQLQCGIRALDIRCRHYQDKFPIHHEIFFQHIDFGDVQKECIDFLTLNPSETIIMHIKPEWNAADNTETFETTFDKYISPN